MLYLLHQPRPSFIFKSKEEISPGSNQGRQFQSNCTMQEIIFGIHSQRPFLTCFQVKGNGHTSDYKLTNIKFVKNKLLSNTVLKSRK